MFKVINNSFEKSSIQTESGLGAIDIDAITNTFQSGAVAARESYMKWNDEHQFKIGEYALKNGNSVALRNFKHKFPGLRESTVRTFKAHTEKELQAAPKEKREGTKSLPKYSKPTARPLMHGEHDNMDQPYLKVVSSCGALINSSLAIATAKTPY